MSRNCLSFVGCFLLSHLLVDGFLLVFVICIFVFLLVALSPSNNSMIGILISGPTFFGSKIINFSREVRVTPHATSPRNKALLGD